MRKIPFPDFQTDPNCSKDIINILEKGGIACIPGATGYKLFADLASPQAVTNMLLAKRRVRNAPALVFVPDERWVHKIAVSVSDEAKALIEAFWPGPMTLLVKVGDELHPKVKKVLIKKKGWLGVRIPEDDVSIQVARAFGRPILVSSANLAKKGGAHSAAQVKKNFGRTVDLMVDAGDLEVGSSSTLVDVTGEKARVVRVGAIKEKEIMSVLDTP